VANDEPKGPDEELDQTQQAGEQLTDELAKKYDPSRLLKMVSTRAGRGQALEHDVRAKYEKKFGVDLGHVRVITGQFAQEFNKQRSAHAVTIGGTGMILLGGTADRSPISRSGQALLAHELTHVAQAKKGLWNADKDGGHAHEHADEAEAHAVEHQEASGDTAAAAAAGSNSVAAKEKKAEQIQKITDRVMDMAADAARTQWMRNNLGRRP
jgi:hypothetical protein